MDAEGDKTSHFTNVWDSHPKQVRVGAADLSRLEMKGT